MSGRHPAADPSDPAFHWTDVVYRHHAGLFYDVEATFFQNARLTRQELDRVTELGERLGSPVRSPVVDLACGPGRHTLELARRGFAVTGIDLSAPFLVMARATAATQPAGPQPRFACGDLRRLALADQSCSSALLLGNSFGYFSDAENQSILREIHRILRPGGLLCLEITHREAFLADFEPYEEELIDGRYHDRLHCQWWKRWDPKSQRMFTLERHSLAGSGEVLYEGPYDVRLYGWRELRRLLVACGFRDPLRGSLTPTTDGADQGLGKSFGLMSELLFVAARS